MATTLNGLVLSTISGNIMDSELQSDGKIVVTGYDRTSHSLLTARFNNNGSLDKTFGLDGSVIESYAGFASARGLCIDKTGSIFVFGDKTDYLLGPVSFVTLKYDVNGVLDTDFRGTGIVSTYFDSYYAFDGSVNGSGEFLVAGGDGIFAVAKYHANGTLDTSFDNDGMVETAGDGVGGAATSVTWLSGGKVLVAGWSTLPKDAQVVFTLIKYNKNGSLDTTFGGDGIVSTAFDEGSAYVTDVVVQTNGKIVVAGRGDGILIARYNSDGTLDTSFDGDGKVTTLLTNYVGAESIALQADGKIVVGGYTTSTPNGQDFALARYNIDGSLDKTFSGDGIVTTDFGGNLDACFDVIVQPDGKIVATGRANGIGGGEIFYALARYNADGTLDATFNGLPQANLPVVGNDTNESFASSVGDDTIDGGAGIDMVSFAQRRTDYLVSKVEKGYLVKSNAGDDGADTLTNIERLQFSDKKIALDLTPDGNAGKTLEFIGMMAHSLVNAPSAVGTILSIFDQGKNMKEVCQLAIDVGLTRDLAGSSSNLDLAKLVFQNVVGSEASAGEAEGLASYIQGSGGSMTQADFLATVAQLDLNNQHIGLVGLQQTGVEYII